MRASKRYRNTLIEQSEAVGATPSIRPSWHSQNSHSSSSLTWCPLLVETNPISDHFMPSLPSAASYASCLNANLAFSADGISTLGRAMHRRNLSILPAGSGARSGSWVGRGESLPCSGICGIVRWRVGPLLEASRTSVGNVSTMRSWCTLCLP